MFCIIICAFLTLNSTISTDKTGNFEIENAVCRLTKDLIAKYPHKCKVQVAVLQFRTSNNHVPRLNQLIQNEVNKVLSKEINFKAVEQYSVNRLVDELGWNLESAASVNIYSNLNEGLLRANEIIADVFIYGIIKVDDENIFITGYLLPNGDASKTISATVQIPISDVPRNYLECN